MYSSLVSLMSRIAPYSFQNNHSENDYLCGKWEVIVCEDWISQLLLTV
jgi:hypothetical protein